MRGERRAEPGNKIPQPKVNFKRTHPMLSASPTARIEPRLGGKRMIAASMRSALIGNEKAYEAHPSIAFYRFAEGKKAILAS
jgi:hypothetical protein